MCAKRLRTAAASGGLWLAALVTPALADGLCSGTMTGSVLAPPPRPTTVSVVQPVSDDANPGLAQQFLNGLRTGGLAVVAPGQGSTQLDVTSTVTAGPGASNVAFKGFGWMSGTQMPNGAAGAMPGSAISITVEATNTTDQTMTWVGTIQCTVSTKDPNALAAHMGELVARMLGRSVERQAF